MKRLICILSFCFLSGNLSAGPIASVQYVHNVLNNRLGFNLPISIVANKDSAANMEYLLRMIDMANWRTKAEVTSLGSGQFATQAAADIVAVNTIVNTIPYHPIIAVNTSTGGGIKMGVRISEPDEHLLHPYSFQIPQFTVQAGDVLSIDIRKEVQNSIGTIPYIVRAYSKPIGMSGASSSILALIDSTGKLGMYGYGDSDLSRSISETAFGAGDNISIQITQDLTQANITGKFGTTYPAINPILYSGSAQSVPIFKTSVGRPITIAYIFFPHISHKVDQPYTFRNAKYVSGGVTKFDIVPATRGTSAGLYEKVTNQFVAIPDGVIVTQ